MSYSRFWIPLKFFYGQKGLEFEFKKNVQPSRGKLLDCSQNHLKGFSAKKGGSIKIISTTNLHMYALVGVGW